MSPLPQPRRYTVGEEIAHSVTHGLGILLSLVGLVVLVAAASVRGTTREVVGCSVFGVCLVILYTTSTLYHSIPLPHLRPVLQMLDHSGIYILIAGTYTPFTLSKLPGPVGSTLLTILWITAVVAIVLGVVLGRRFRPVALVLYLVMGWSIVFVLEPLRESLAPAGFSLLFAGGLAYTFGMVFYAMRKVRYSHAVWHLCVLAGSILQFLCVLLYVIPPG
jgi:hemolysin III